MKSAIGYCAVAMMTVLGLLVTRTAGARDAAAQLRDAATLLAVDEYHAWYARRRAESDLFDSPEPASMVSVQLDQVPFGNSERSAADGQLPVFGETPYPSSIELELTYSKRRRVAGQLPAHVIAGIDFTRLRLRHPQAWFELAGLEEQLEGSVVAGIDFAVLRRRYPNLSRDALVGFKLHAHGKKAATSEDRRAGKLEAALKKAKAAILALKRELAADTTDVPGVRDALDAIDAVLLPYQSPTAGGSTYNAWYWDEMRKLSDDTISSGSSSAGGDGHWQGKMTMAEAAEKAAFADKHWREQEAQRKQQGAAGDRHHDTVVSSTPAVSSAALAKKMTPHADADAQQELVREYNRWYASQLADKS